MFTVNAEILAQGLVLLALAGLAPMCAWLIRIPRTLLIALLITGTLQVAQPWLEHGSAALALLRLAAVGVVVAARLWSSFRDRPKWFALQERAFDVALLYLFVGSVWWLAWAGGFAIQGFGGLQALLTAAHFHVAGMGACTVAGLLGQWFENSPGRNLLRAAVVAMVSGVAVLAIGIAAYRPLEEAAAWWVALAAMGLAVALLFRVRSARSPLVKLCSALAGLSPLVPAVLAIRFSQGGFAGLEAGSLETMVFFHAVPNAVGFVGLGLLSFVLERDR